MAMARGRAAASRTPLPAMQEPTPVAQEAVSEAATGESHGECEETVATSSKGEKRVRSKNWTLHEILILVEAKRVEWSAVDSGNLTSRDVIETAASKWKKISDSLERSGVIRNADMCKTKWENILSDYKMIKDFEKKTGNPPYFALSKNEKKVFKMPLQFEKSVYEGLDTFQGRRPAIVPPSMIDSSRDVEQSDTDVTPGDREAGSSGKKRKSSAMEGFAKIIGDVEEKKIAIQEKFIDIEAAKVGAEREHRERFVLAFESMARSWEKLADRHS